MKLVLLLLPAMLLGACDGNSASGIACINGVLHTQVGVVGSIYEPTKHKCVDLKSTGASS